jgi:anti-sigma factor RsiW
VRLVEGVTGSVPPGDRTAIIGHLVTCARCRDEAAAIEATAARLREAGGFTTPPGFWPDFTRQLDARIEAERLPAFIRFRRWLALPRHALGTAAVTVLATLTIFTAVRFVPPRPAAPDPVPAQVRGLVTETMTTTLPSLGEMLETWRAGLPQEADQVSDRTGP